MTAFYRTIAAALAFLTTQAFAADTFLGHPTPIFRLLDNGERRIDKYECQVLRRSADGVIRATMEMVPCNGSSLVQVEQGIATSSTCRTRLQVNVPASFHGVVFSAANLGTCLDGERPTEQVVRREVLTERVTTEATEPLFCSWKVNGQTVKATHVLVNGVWVRFDADLCKSVPYPGEGNFKFVQ